MINITNFKTLLKKDTHIICLTIGGIYSGFGVAALLMVKLQSTRLTNFDTTSDELFMHMLNTLHNTWNTYMPLLVFVGLGYLAFGFFYKRINDNKTIINHILSIASICWVIAYSIGSIKYLDLLITSISEDFEAFKYVGYLFSGFGFIAVLALFTVPQYHISKRIRSLQA